MKYLKLVPIFLAVGFVSLLGCPQKRHEVITRTALSPDMVRIGSLIPLTGKCRTFGENVRRGIELAVEKINNAGGIDGRKIAVLYEDDHCEASYGIEAINRLLAEGAVSAIIGAVVSPVTLAVAPIAESHKIILISPTSTNTRLRNAGDYFYRVCPSDAAQGVYLARFAREQLAAKKAAVIYQDNEYGSGLKDSFVEDFLKLDGEIVLIDRFKSIEESDMNGILERVKSKMPDIIFLPAFIHDAPSVLKAARNLGLNQVFLLGDAANQRELIDKAGNAAEGVLIAALSFGYGETDTEVEDFRQLYINRYGVEPETDAGYAFDAMLVLAEAARLGGGPTRLGIARGMKLIRDFRGVTGLTNFDTNGEVEKPITLRKVENGQFKSIWQ